MRLSVMDARPYRPERPGRMQALPLNPHRRVARSHRRPERGGEAAVAGLLHQVEVAVAEVDGIAVRCGEVPYRNAQLVLDPVLRVADLVRGRRVVLIGQS